MMQSALCDLLLPPAQVSGRPIDRRRRSKASIVNQAAVVMFQHPARRKVPGRRSQGNEIESSVERRATLL